MKESGCFRNRKCETCGFFEFYFTPVWKQDEGEWKPGIYTCNRKKTIIEYTNYNKLKKLKCEEVEKSKEPWEEVMMV